MKPEPAVGAGLALLLAAAPLAEAAAAGADLRSCGDARSAWQLSCPATRFDETGYRAEDPRPELIRRRGYGGSGLFNGGTELTVRPAEVPGALRKLSPGAQLIIRDGVWANVELTIRAEGTQERPILVRPQRPGGVQLTGRSRLTVVGSHVIVDGLVIRDGEYATSTSVVRIGTSEEPCNSCVAMSFRMQSLSAVPGSRLHYLGVRGRDVTIAYSSFGKASSPGHFVYDSHPTEAGSPGRLHLLFNRFYERTANTDENGYELLQLGESTVQAQSMYGRLEHNTFVDSLVPHADTELLTVKSSDWIVRENSFSGCVGDLSLRSTNRVLVERNVFSGGRAGSASGVRVQGAGHFILRNTFERNASPAPTGLPANSAYYYSVLVPAGTVEEVADGEAGEPVAKNIVIANNTFVDGRYNIHLGSFYPQYPIMPRAVLVAGNLIRTHETLPLFVLPKGNEAEFLCNNAVEDNRLLGATTGLRGLLPAAANPWTQLSDGAR